MRHAAAALSLLLAVACGSTVPNPGLADPGLGAPSGPSQAGAGPEAGAGDAGGPAGSPGAAATGTSGGSAGRGGLGSPRSAPAGTPCCQSGAQDGSPVEVGFLQAKDVGAVAKSFGYAGLSSGNGATQARVATALVNQGGGLAGHPVKAVIFEIDVTQNFSTQQQAACGMFFDDHKVVAVASILESVDIVLACARQHGVPFVTGGLNSTSDAVLAAQKLLVLTANPSLDRDVAMLVPQLIRSGWFRPRTKTEVVKVGLIYTDRPEFAQVPRQVAAELRKAGLTLTDTDAAPYTSSTADLQSGTTAGQSAALRFKSDGINRVVVVDATANGLTYFGVAAQQLDYYPLLGLSTLQEPALLHVVLSSRQLAGAAGVGWSPLWDLPMSAQPAGTAASRACLRAMAKAGEDTTVQGVRAYDLITCDGANLLAAAWRTGPLTGSQFLTGLRALGDTWSPAVSFAADFSRHRDGASAFRPLAFSTDCACFRYTGGLVPVP